MLRPDLHILAGNHKVMVIGVILLGDDYSRGQIELFYFVAIEQLKRLVDAPLQLLLIAFAL